MMCPLLCLPLPPVYRATWEWGHGENISLTENTEAYHIYPALNKFHFVDNRSKIIRFIHNEHQT